MGFELMTSSLPRMRSTPELHRQLLERGRRIELPFSAWKADIIAVIRTPHNGGSCSLPLRGQGWIRTTVGVRQQIYSLPHLATLVLALRLQITRSGHLSYIGSMSMPLKGSAKVRIILNSAKTFARFFQCSAGPDRSAPAAAPGRRVRRTRRLCRAGVWQRRSRGS